MNVIGTWFEGLPGPPCRHGLRDRGCLRVRKQRITAPLWGNSGVLVAAFRFVWVVQLPGPVSGCSGVVKVWVSDQSEYPALLAACARMVSSSQVTSCLSRRWVARCWLVHRGVSERVAAGPLLGCRLRRRLRRRCKSRSWSALVTRYGGPYVKAVLVWRVVVLAAAAAFTSVIRSSRLASSETQLSHRNAAVTVGGSVSGSRRTNHVSQCPPTIHDSTALVNKGRS